jgi:4-amino-4-deoxy-L-arabinose transferase-like glycosyltransferase
VSERLVWARARGHWLVLGLIMAVALYMRLHSLASLPPGLHPDEAANGLDVFRILERHDIRPFYSENGGREGLFFLLQSIGVGIFGNTLFGIRVAPALIGTLAVLATYLWGRSWFSARVGLFAAAIMAALPWAVTISRDGFRAGMVALFVPLVLWLYAKAFKTGGVWWFVVAGMALGGGFYTYLAFRLFPLALIALAVLWPFRQPKNIKLPVQKIAISLIAAALTLIPLGLYGLQHPDDLVARPGGVSFTNPKLNHGHPIQTLADTTVKTALMFNFHGDENYRQNLGGQPELNIFIGSMFILGLLICLVRIRSLRFLGLLAVFLAMLLPEVLTAEGIPHALRAIGAMPAAVMLAALGTDYLLTRWYAVFPANSAARAAGLGALIGLVVLSAYQGYSQYFVAWANDSQTYEAYAEDSKVASDFLIQNPSTAKTYVVAGTYQAMPIDYFTHHKTSYARVESAKVDSVPLGSGTPKRFVIFEHDRDSVLKRLNLKFPRGKTAPHYSPFTGKELFVVYSVAS